MNTLRVGRRAFPAVALLAASLALSGATGPSSRTHSPRWAETAVAGRLLYGDPDAERAGKEGPVESVDAQAEYERAFPAAAVPPSGYPLGMRRADDMARWSAPVHWKELGPTYTPDANFADPITGKSTPVSGRATAIAVDPATCSQGRCGTIYLGTATGGLWKSTDAGATWKPLLDRARSLAVGAIAVDPKNSEIVYVGTGEPNHSGDSHAGIGVLRTTDGGKTWTNLGYRQFLNSAIAGLEIDPRTAGGTSATLYAVSTRAEAGLGSIGFRIRTPYLPPLGFYRSTDGGKTWTLSNPSGVQDGAQSLAMDPQNPSVLYAGFNPFPTAHASTSGLYRANGVFKTTDGGRTWTHLSGGLPTTSFETITLAVAPSNPQVVYASYQLTGSSAYNPAPFGSGGVQTLFKSTDGGTSWARLSAAPHACADQCEYDMPLAVDPTDPNVVYAGGTANYDYWFGTNPACANLASLPVECHTTVMKTADGGATWADVSQNAGNGPLHPDDHAILVSPNDPNTVYTAGDGGLFVSADAGKTWKDLNRGVGTIQFTGLAVARDGSIYAGTQDNGTFKYTGSTTWKHFEGGDGGFTATDPKNKNILYTTRQGPVLFRNDGGGDPSKDVFISPFIGDLYLKGQGIAYEPYAVAPSKPSTIFFGTYRVWRSNIRGGVDGNNDGDATNDKSDKNDWVPISFDFRCGSQPANPATVCQGGNLGHGIASLAVSPVNPNVVAVGTSAGGIWLTTNALAKVKTDASCSTLSNDYGMALCDYVSGPSWHRIDRGLPQRYPTAIAFAPGSSTRLYITLSGFDKNTPGHSGHLFASDNGGRAWRNIDGRGSRTSLPDLPFNGIVVNPRNGHLYAAADYGVYASTDGGRTWRRIDQTLAEAPVYQMQYDAHRNALAVATHGRGVWEVSAP